MENRPNIIDFEASGLGNNSYPIEVGIVLSNGQKYCSLITPAPDWNHWDIEAEKIHGISREQLLLHGKSISIVTRELNQFLGDKTVYSDCWVVDKPWLSVLFYKSGCHPLFKISALEMILKESQMQIWSQTKQQVINDLLLTRHRASSDALIIQETFFRSRHIDNQCAVIF